MLGVKEMVKNVPGALSAYRGCQRLLLRWRPAEDVFTDIYRGKKFGGRESVSGPGSSLARTAAIRNQLPGVFRDFDIHTMLDIPCGDFNWMKSVDFESVDYTGADIVADLIQQNKQYETSNIHFRKLNLIDEKLPKVDLVFCRDCLVHLPNKDVFSSLQNICDSGSTYLLTTTFTSRRHNPDIVAGNWRPLNLEAPPFSFPKPLGTINEGCDEGGGQWKDKSLGLWRAADVAECLNKHRS